MIRNGNLTKDQLIEVAESANGNFIYDPDYKEFADLDGKEAKRYLESKGFTVANHYDTGRNGLALTTCGVRLSTNGHLSKKKLG
ncbi:MAG: hypothetical protein JWM44_2066 [Bacilli bacterium]|nr:hypothetical protein [Bacilli bacterium]